MYTLVYVHQEGDDEGPEGAASVHSKTKSRFAHGKSSAYQWERDWIFRDLADALKIVE